MPRWPAPLLLVSLAAVGPAAPGLLRPARPTPTWSGTGTSRPSAQGGIAVRTHYVPAHAEFTAGGERIGRNRNGVIVSTERYSPQTGPAPRG